MFRLATLFALLMGVVGWSGLAQADAFDALRPAPEDTSTAKWCAVLNDTPQPEVSALEAEPDGEPVAPELPSIIRPLFGATARFTSTGQVLHAATETYTVRFAASPVLARAPPRAVR